MSTAATEPVAFRLNDSFYLAPTARSGVPKQNADAHLMRTNVAFPQKAPRS